MLETFMGLSLAIMGFYFLKSTDLSQEMKDRSAQLRSEAAQNPIVRTKKMAFDSISKNNKILDDNQNSKLVLLANNKKELELKQKNQEIDELTLKITLLEQELKINNKRNNEIMAEIEIYLKDLTRLTASIA
jgi:type I site-specific restriction endonuclease